MSPEKLRRRAMALGAELEIDGKTINAGRQQLRVVPTKPAAAAPAAPMEPAAPQSDPLAAIAQAMTLQTQIAAAQAEGQMRVLSEMLDRVLGKSAPMQPAAPREAAPAPSAEPATPAPPTTAAPPPLIMPVQFKVLRDTTGWAQGLEPVYGEVSSASLASLATTTDSRGLIDTITPSYA